MREFTATSYWGKLALLGGCIAGTLFLARLSRRATAATGFPAGAKVVGVWLILSWLAIVMLGRMIGYDLAIWGSLSLRT